MDIAFIDVTATLFYGGVQTAVWQLAAALADRGHRVTVYGGDGPVRPDLGGRPVTVRTFPYTPRERLPNLGTRFRKFGERWTFARHARRTVATAGHDWVVLTKPFDFFWPRLMPAGSRTRFAFMSGGTDFFRGDRWLARRIDALVACSHFNAQQNIARYKRPVGVIFNGVDTERFRPGLRDEARRRALGFADGDVVFVYAGRVVGLKGLDIPIRALADPAVAGLPVKLLIVGDGAALPRLRQLALDSGVAGRVVCHPAVPHAELPALFACADAGLFPTRGEEAFGIAVAEAMACGLPVVASHSGGMPEVVGNEGSCGELFAIGDVAGCARAMAALAGEPALRRQAGEAARRRVAGRYTWARAAGRLEGALAAAA